MSKFYGIGVGPGDPDLITVKATRLLKEVDIILVPTAKKGVESLALSIARPYIKPGFRVEERTFPMVTDLEVKTQAWDAISSEVMAWVNQGLSVAFLTLGDTMTYATYIYLLERLDGKIDIETVPGITSYQGVAATTNTPLVIDDMMMTVVSCNVPIETIRQRVKQEEAVVLMKLSLQFRDIINMLIEEGLAPYTTLVSHATQERQVLYKDIRTITDDSISYFSTMIINKRWAKA